MGKPDAPKPPDMTEIAKANIESAKLWEAVARDQLDWAKSQSAENRAILERVLGVQLPIMEQQYENALKDRQRYEEVTLPLRDNLIEEFQSYDTPERREEKAAERMADVRNAFEAQRNNALQRLEGYGVDPSQVRNFALDRGVRATEAAQTALAANQGREQVENVGRALRAEAINIESGLPSQVAQSYGQAIQAGQAGVGGANQTTGTSSAALQGAATYGQMGQQGYMNAANVQNMGYQNSLAQWQANQQGAAGFGELVGTLGSAGILALSDPKAKEGRRPVKGALDAVRNARSEEWEYRPETGMDDGQRHVGPMADDVRREMGIGNGSAIPLVDMMGAHQAALGEVADRLDRLEQGGGAAMAISPEILAELGADVLEDLIEKRKGRRAKRAGAQQAIPA